MTLSLARGLMSAVQSGHRVFIHGGAATPTRLIEALVAEADRLRDVEIVHLHTIGQARYAEPSFAASFKVSAFFVGSNLRPYVQSGAVDYIPCFLSEIPPLLRSGRFPIDVALVHVSPADAQGFHSLGTSVDVARAAVDVAKVVIAQINPHMPRVHGDGFIHKSKIHCSIEVNDPLPEERENPPTAVEKSIANHVAGLIDDASTLQVGIGAIPDAVLSALKDRRHLGVHSEMWSDGVLELIRCGAVDNSRKKIHPGKSVSGFVLGSKALYDFVNDNPSVVQLDISYINNPGTIARNPKVVAINSAIEIDLTGQVCADSVGQRIVSGVGGQMDFIRGASLSPGGKPIIAIASRSKRGAPRIVPTLKLGAGVVTTRAHVHYVATEYGIADLYGKNLKQRARALIGIAHPDDRESLERAWHPLQS